GCGHVGIFDLILRNTFRLRNGFKQRRPLIERDHAKMAVRVGKPCQAAILTNRSHSSFLMKATQSSMVGMPARPPGRMHFSAAAADANDMASCTASSPPIANA